MSCSASSNKQSSQQAGRRQFFDGGQPLAADLAPQVVEPVEGGPIPALLNAQGPTGEIRIEVKDRTGAGVEADGRLENLATGVDRRFRIWCNVSAGQLTRAEPTRRLAALLDYSGCDPHMIGIEITEIEVLRDSAKKAAEQAGLSPRSIDEVRQPPLTESSSERFGDKSRPVEPGPDAERRVEAGRVPCGIAILSGGRPQARGRLVPAQRGCGELAGHRRGTGACAGRTEAVSPGVRRQRRLGHQSGGSVPPHS